MGRYGYDSGYDDGRAYNNRFEDTIRHSRGSSRRDYDDYYDEDDYYDDYDDYEEDGYEDNRRYDGYEEDDRRYSDYEEDRYEDNRRNSDYEEDRYEDSRRNSDYKEVGSTRDNRGEGSRERESLVIRNKVIKKCDDASLIEEIREFLGESILLTLKPDQLNVLGQVFRPIFLGKLEEVGADYILLKNVNIKMSNAPEYIFPTPLIIPIEQIVWFSPFDSEKVFPLY